MFFACFSSDELLELRLQAIPLSVHCTIAFAFEPSEVHPSGQEVVAPLLAAGVRSAFARRSLPTVAAVMVCFAHSLAWICHLAKYYNLASSQAANWG